MRLTLLSRDEIKTIYDDRMVEDFPDNELKPYFIMEEMLEQGIYDCYALSDDQKFYGYVYCIRIKNQDKNLYLIDYLAIFKEYRNQGFGSIMLRLLPDVLEASEAIILESENPDYATNEEEKETQNRRVQFYLKNGLYDSGATELLYFVEYKLMAVDLEGIKRMTAGEMLETIDIIYKAILPPDIYEKNLLYH